MRDMFPQVEGQPECILDDFYLPTSADAAILKSQFLMQDCRPPERKNFSH